MRNLPGLPAQPVNGNPMLRLEHIFCVYEVKKNLVWGDGMLDHFLLAGRPDHKDL